MSSTTNRSRKRNTAAMVAVLDVVALRIAREERETQQEARRLAELAAEVASLGRKARRA